MKAENNFEKIIKKIFCKYLILNVLTYLFPGIKVIMKTKVSNLAISEVRM